MLAMMTFGVLAIGSELEDFSSDLCFPLFGVILLALAFNQFLRLRSTIEREHFRPQALLALLFAVGVGLVALVLTLSLLKKPKSTKWSLMNRSIRFSCMRRSY
jgi:uncharacterized membrane protein YidH (DUF202 family)